LAGKLLGLKGDQDVVQFQMGGLVRLDRGEPGDWVVHWMIMPDQLVHG
jgi:hypothetical protein